MNENNEQGFWKLVVVILLLYVVAGSLDYAVQKAVEEDRKGLQVTSPTPHEVQRDTPTANS